MCQELQLLERQTTFLRRNTPLDQLLATQRAQKQLLGQRLPFLADQVEALRDSRDFLRTHRELIALEAQLLRLRAQCASVKQGDACRIVASLQQAAHAEACACHPALPANEAALP